MTTRQVWNSSRCEHGDGRWPLAGVLFGLAGSAALVTGVAQLGSPVTVEGTTSCRCLHHRGAPAPCLMFFVTPRGSPCMNEKAFWFGKSGGTGLSLQSYDAATNTSSRPIPGIGSASPAAGVGQLPAG